MSIHNEQLIPNGKEVFNAPHIDLGALLPPLFAASYPFLLMLLHSRISTFSSEATFTELALLLIVSLLVLSIPVVGITIAGKNDIQASLRRLAYASVLAPTLYVLLGVVQALISSPVPDPLAWCAIWLCASVVAFRTAKNKTEVTSSPQVPKLRIAHGVSALILCFYIFFHLGNHLAGLLGPQEHRSVMDFGRIIYRSAYVEPFLIAVFLFQVSSGLYLAWYWSAEKQDFFKTFQIASGVYLSVFILGHMNSVFIYARSYLGVPTDWNFATGAPAGLMYDPWNIRLIPHYTLGVFFFLSHLNEGLRGILLAHGCDRQIAQRLWLGGFICSAVIAAAIIAGMCGVRI